MPPPPTNDGAETFLCLRLNLSGSVGILVARLQLMLATFQFIYLILETRNVVKVVKFKRTHLVPDANVI